MRCKRCFVCFSQSKLCLADLVHVAGQVEHLVGEAPLAEARLESCGKRLHSSLVLLLGEEGMDDNLSDLLSCSRRIFSFKATIAFVIVEMVFSSS